MQVNDGAAFGHYLKATRERQRITLELVSHRTKIAPRLIAALERGDVGACPPGIYRRAMIRAYAEAIGLDPDAALDQFRTQLEPAPAATGPRPEAPPPPNASWLRQAAQLAGAAAVVAIVVGALASAVRRAPQNGEPIVHAEAVPPPAHARRAAAERDAARNAAAHAAAPVATSGDAAASGDAEAENGRLAIESDPPGAGVTVNGIRRGVTPLTVGGLPPGEKRVRLILDGYVSAERVAMLSPGRTSAVIRVTLLPRVSRSP